MDRGCLTLWLHTAASSSAASGKPLCPDFHSICVCVVLVCLISFSLRQGVLAVTGLLNISGSTVDMAGRETPTAHVINVATQCSCLDSVCVWGSVYVCKPLLFTLPAWVYLLMSKCESGWLFSSCCGGIRCCSWTEANFPAETEKERELNVRWIRWWRERRRIGECSINLSVTIDYINYFWPTQVDLFTQIWRNQKEKL